MLHHLRTLTLTNRSRAPCHYYACESLRPGCGTADAMCNPREDVGMSSPLWSYLTNNELLPDGGLRYGGRSRNFLSLTIGSLGQKFVAIIFQFVAADRYQEASSYGMFLQYPNLCFPRSNIQSISNPAQLYPIYAIC